MPKQQLTVMISSTARDLPEHRKQIVEACLRQNMFPLRMEDLPANSDEAVAASLKMVEEADVYIGVFANRYGYIPKTNNPREVSVTELEYDRAVERKIERLIFVMDKTHPITVDDVDIENAAKLKAFKNRVQTENIVNFFSSPDALRAEAINSLSKLRQPDLTTFHYVSDIPAPPEAFIAHPYTLLQTHKLVGRQRELNLLTDWVAKPDSEIYKARILNIVAIGGLGKSALTWKWFNDIAPQEMKPLAGRMWWSFYESDATFENSVTRALAYVKRLKLDEAQEIPAPEREAQLLAVLNREPFLIVLDGLERMLIAYARMDAAHLSDDDYDKQTANYVANAIGLPATAAQSFTGEHRLRKTADPRAGAFLRKLSGVRAARILVSTRLYPADLQVGTGSPRPGCYAIFLQGLADDDALELWRAFGVTGARDSLLRLFNRVGNHSLLVQILAGEVARYRPVPGDFQQWRRGHPDFDPFSLPMVQVKSHVLDFAMRGLDSKSRQVLRIIAAFRMPGRYDALASLLIGKEKACVDERELDGVLSDLEDRGLVGWERRANRYDLHPIVRGVVWSRLADGTRKDVYATLNAHFAAIPEMGQEDVRALEDLSPGIELFSTLIGLKNYADANRLFSTRLAGALKHLAAFRQIIELLSQFFLDGIECSPCVEDSTAQASILGGLALAHLQIGDVHNATLLYRRDLDILKRDDQERISSGLLNLSVALFEEGGLREADFLMRQALAIFRLDSDKWKEGVVLVTWGSAMAARGNGAGSLLSIQRASKIFETVHKKRGFTNIWGWGGVVNNVLSQRALWLGKFTIALSSATRARKLCQMRFAYQPGIIESVRLQGAAALGMGDFVRAGEHLQEALVQARDKNLMSEELMALVNLAEMRRRLRDRKAARELLDDVWELAERAPYPLIHADAFNVLAHIEVDGQNTTAAVEAATKAYQLAWCDGPPFAYHWGVEAAKQHLNELGAPEPEMPPFDESRFEPMPDAEIDPDDEFHVGNTLDEFLFSDPSGLEWY